VSNALTVVTGWLDRLDAELEDASPGVRDALETAARQARLAFRVCRRAIGAEVDREPSRPVGDVLMDAAQAVKVEAVRHAVTVQLGSITGGELAEPGGAEQILLNLLLNAIAFSPPGSVVELAAVIEDEVAVLSVQDQGPGIEAERAEELLQGAPSTRRGGAGIGLVHSAALARAHGGELALSHPGPGARFLLRWPLAIRPSSLRPVSQPRRSLEGLRVLLLEDDDGIAELVALGLEAQGVRVVRGTNLVDVRSLGASERRFAATLVDLSPLGHDVDRGILELAELVQGPLVLMTGSSQPMPPEVDHRLAAWVRKPFEVRELVNVLSEVVGR